MPFQLEQTVQVTITNANPRRELHGEEHVRAIDLSFSLTGENTLLDLIEPGLREFHYCNKALKAGQKPLPNVVVPLPNLRFPKLPLTVSYAKGEKWRNFRFIWDFGTQEAKVDFTDVVLSNLHYELMEGGSVTIFGTIQYNGDELVDNDVYGELCGLASEGEIYIKLLAPPELVLVKKGYRAGRPDTPPPKDPAQAELGAAGGHVGDADAFEVGEDDDVEHAEGSPEAALAATEKLH